MLDCDSGALRVHYGRPHEVITFIVFVILYAYQAPLFRKLFGAYT